MAASNTHIDELLNLYLDRELTREEEEQLYSRLADDAQLRAHLKHLQVLRSETRNYLATLTPPAAVTGSVFAGLGFSSTTASAASAAAGEAAREAAALASSSTAGAGAAAGSAATGAATASVATASALVTTLKTLWIPITAAVISATITTVVVLSVVDHDTPPPTMEPKSGQIQQQPVQQPVQTTVPEPDETKRSDGSRATSGMPAPDLQTGALKAKPDAAPSHSKAQKQTVPEAAASNAKTQKPAASERIAKPVTPAKQTPAPARSLPAISAIEESPAETETSAKPAQTAATATRSAVPFTMLENLQRTPFVLTPGETRGTELTDRIVLVLDEPPQTGFAVKLRGYAAQAFPGVTVGTRAKHDLERMFENASVGLYYRFSSNEVLGVEIGQDAFAQRYNGFIRGKDREVQQNLLTPWAMLNYRYSFDGMFGQVLLRPYIGAGSGFTQQAWSLSSGSAGFILAPNNSIEMMFGLEGMLLAYPFDGEWFTSKKLGFSYALVVNF